MSGEDGCTFNRIGFGELGTVLHQLLWQLIPFLVLLEAEIYVG